MDAERRPIHPVTVRADRVIVAGGAIETPHLLLRSAVPDPSGQLGRNLHLHPGAPVVGSLCVNRKFEKLMPTRSLPFGISSARAGAEHSIMTVTWCMDAMEGRE